MGSNPVSLMATQETELVIRPARGTVVAGLREMFSYRDLLYFLTWRDVKVRYKQTLFGLLWAILQPLLMMVIFTVFFGRLAHVPSNGIPYPVFAYAGLVPWTLFSQVVVNSSLSLVQNVNMVSKVYFPRLILPVASSGAFIVDFGAAMLVFLGVASLY